MGRKYFTVLVVLIIILSAVSGLSAARKKRVAVLNFSNYGPRNIAFLKNALPESLSSSLSEVKDIRVIERRQLGRIINELALEQTGMINTRGVNRAGRLARADVLILGSISGSKKRIIVTMKAVEVATGKVLDGKVVKASMGDVFDRAGEAARTMAAVISGKGIGRLSVSSTPSGSKIYIDGMPAGKTPIVEYKLVKGKHRIKVVRDGYVDYETSIYIEPKKREQVNAFLAKDVASDRWEIYASAAYTFLFNDTLKNNILYTVGFGHTFDAFLISGEINFNYSNHDDLIENWPFSSGSVMERNYLFTNFAASVTYSPFGTWRYIQPYAGISIGYTILTDYTNTTSTNEDDRINLFSYGTKIGANLFPFSNFSIFIEVRFIGTAPKFTRNNYSWTGLGMGGYLEKNSEKISYAGASIGGGVKIFF